jgi:hypothetical protein
MKTLLFLVLGFASVAHAQTSVTEEAPAYYLFPGNMPNHNTYIGAVGFKNEEGCQANVVQIPVKNSKMLNFVITLENEKCADESFYGPDVEPTTEDKTFIYAKRGTGISCFNDAPFPADYYVCPFGTVRVIDGQSFVITSDVGDMKKTIRFNALKN